jgi:hypothetical protein
MTLISKTRSHAERGLDAYFTPKEAIRALLALEKIPSRVYSTLVVETALYWTS